MKETEAVIEAHARVMSAGIKPFEYKDHTPGEVLEIRATGTWGEHKWPVSLHITVPPGEGAIPLTGDFMKITVQRDSPSRVVYDVRF